MDGYDLYICCTQQDAHWAARLENSIRGYRLPGNVALPQGAPGYRNIVVDASEAPFNEETAALLGRARCLLVVCTPRARHSQPILDRLLCFESIRQRQGVIAVLAEGEPIDAFPPFFIEERVVPHMLPDGSIEERVETVEPVASDLRAENPRRARQLLQYETVRIVAALLGLPPDALEQRHNQRTRRRMQALVGLVAAAALISGGILGYFGLQSMRAGALARAQEQESMAVAQRIIQELPARFAGEPEALDYVYETIQTAIQTLYETGSNNLAGLDTGEILAAQPEDSPSVLLRKASLLRLTGAGGEALPLYRAGVRAGTEDAALIEALDAAVERLCAGEYGLALCLTAGSEHFAPGELITGLEGAPLPSADLAALVEGLEEETVSVQVLPAKAGAPPEERQLPREALLGLETLSV